MGISFPKCFDAARVPEEVRLKVTYVNLVPRGNETLCLGATLLAFLRALASFLEADAGSTARAFMLPGLYVTPPVTSRPSIGLITYVIQSVVMLKAFPKRFDAASCSLEELGLHT